MLREPAARRRTSPPPHSRCPPTLKPNPPHDRQRIVNLHRRFGRHRRASRDPRTPSVQSARTPRRERRATSRSTSSFIDDQALTDARTRPNAGMLRITPSPASRATCRRPGPRRAAHGTSAAAVERPRGHTDSPRSASRSVRAASGQRRGARSGCTQSQPASSNTPSDAVAHALRIPAGKPWSKRLTPSACSNSSALAGSATEPYPGHGTSRSSRRSARTNSAPLPSGPHSHFWPEPA